MTLCKVQWRAETGEISQIGLVISDKDIGDGGDTEAGVEHKAGERESLHQLQVILVMFLAFVILRILLDKLPP